MKRTYFNFANIARLNVIPTSTLFIAYKKKYYVTCPKYKLQKKIPRCVYHY